MHENVVPFKKNSVRNYLDTCIKRWRSLRNLSSEGAEYYIDAYQSVRVSLFGEKLAIEAAAEQGVARENQSLASVEETEPAN